MVFFDVIHCAMKSMIVFLLVHNERYMMPCLNKKIFGVECPGCGLQRSVNLLLHGEFLAAFKMYPAIYPMIFLAIFLTTNLFVKMRYSYFIKWFLIAVTVGTILISYLIKMNNLYN